MCWGVSLRPAPPRATLAKLIVAGTPPWFATGRCWASIWPPRARRSHRGKCAPGRGAIVPVLVSILAAYEQTLATPLRTGVLLDGRLRRSDVGREGLFSPLQA